MKITTINIILIFALLALTVKGQTSKKVDVKIDGSQKFQQIDGFGVNINTAWWYNGEYR